MAPTDGDAGTWQRLVAVLRGRDGALSGEYVAVLGLVAAVIAGLVGLALPERVGAEGDRAVCAVFDPDGTCAVALPPGTDGPGGADDGGSDDGGSDDAGSDDGGSDGEDDGGSDDAGSDGEDDGSDGGSDGEDDGSDGGSDGEDDGSDDEDDGPDVDQDRVDEAREQLEDLLGGTVFGGPVPAILELLAGLTDDELNAVLDGLSDDDLARLADLLSQRQSPFESPEEAQRRLGDLLRRLDEDNVDRLGDLHDGLSPPFDDVDHVESAKDETGENPLTYGPVDGELFVDGPTWDDIHQGTLGDCHVLASLGAMAAADPDLITDMITDNGNGTYTVTFPGPPEAVVTVDDRFPVDDDGQPSFAQAGEPPELWPLVVEKALAQLRESYGGIEGAPTNETLAYLVGRDTDSRDPEDVSASDLADRFAAGEPIALRSFQPDDAEDKEPYHADFEDVHGDPLPPLYAAHAYFVVAVDEDAGTVTVRNPHGPHTPDIEVRVEDLERLFNKVVTLD